MDGQVHIPADVVARRYEAVVRISEALVGCRQPEELAKSLADLINEFLSFEYLDVLVFKRIQLKSNGTPAGKG